MLLTNKLKKYPKTEPCNSPDVTWKGKELYQKREPEIVFWLSNCETSERNHQGIQRNLTYEREGYVGRREKHFKDHNSGQ
jgi:hypothetical protein